MGELETCLAKPELIPLLRVMGIVVLLQQLGAVHASLLGRELRYKEVLYANFPGMLISGLVGVVLALAGFGVWALVAQAITMPLITSTLLWKFSGWSPAFALSRDSIRKLLPFGWRTAANQLLNAVFNNVYVLVIGRFYPVVEVAYYQRAKAFQGLLTMNMMQIFNRVGFPVMSRMNGEGDERIRHGFLKLMAAITWIILPAFALLAALSVPIVDLLLTSKWLPVVPYLKILCLMGVFIVLNVVNVNYLQAKGRADTVLRLSMIAKVLVVVNLCITIPHGVEAMLWGHLLTVLINFVLRLYVLDRSYAIKFTHQLKVIGPPFILAVSIYLIICWVTSLIPMGHWLDLITGSSIALLLWWGALICFRSSFDNEIDALEKQYPALRPFFKYSGLRWSDI